MIYSLRVRACRPQVVVAVCVAILAGCGASDELPVLSVDMPLHLEDHLDAARVTGSVAPAGSEVVEWRFDEPQPDWKPAPSWSPVIGSARTEFTGEALRVTLTEATRNLAGVPNGGIYVDVPAWSIADWSDVVVRLRSDSTVSNILVRLNLREGRGVAGEQPNPFEASGVNVPVVRDGTVQTYRLRWPDRPGGYEVRQLGIWFGAQGGPGSVDLLSVSVSPVGEAYRDPPLGVRQVAHDGRSRRALYTHAPSRLEYRLEVPEGGRFDHGVDVLRPDVPVTFRVSVQSADGTSRQLDEQTVSDPNAWLQRSVDLSEFAGETVTLVLESDAATPGTIGFWGAPTVSGSTAPRKPNVIFYVIDGGGADQMSLYGYNRRTTPNLEALASEGAVFEWAYSNSSWSKPSTTSFMTSLQNSVLGNTGDRFDLLPAEAKTMAERFHEAGYPTGVFTSNPWAGSFANLDRGVDVFRDEGAEVTSRSSVELHHEFWEWRDAYSTTPYWVHFQTTDVHSPYAPQPPFAGLFAPIGTERRLAHDDSLLAAWRQANQARVQAGEWSWFDQFEGAGVDRVGNFDRVRAVYDEAMAHQDYQLGRFVQRLKASGDWENTLLIVAADHGIEAAYGDFITLLGDRDAWDAPWAVLRASVSRVPLLFVWPARIPAGQRITERVSMIDVLPTVLDLVGLPQPEVLQGQSLAPLLDGTPGWEPRPVIFDDFRTDFATGEREGQIEVIDGRWGASLQIGDLEDSGRKTPLLLYDIYEDPLALHPINDEHPELVAKYAEFLNQQWEAHQLLARRFTPGGSIELTAEQLETLRTLGYIR